jgi:hypothetical protein
MMLDDVYGPDEDEFPPDQEAEEWDADALGLEWEEDEVQAVRDEIAGQRG